MRRFFSLPVLLLLAFSGTVAYEQSAPGQTVPRSAVDYYSRGIARGEKGDSEGAIADFTKAIEINPRYAEAYYNRGVARFRRGDADGAIADYTRAIEIDPRLAQAYYGRGDARFHKHDDDGAIADFTKAIEINPRSAKAYSRRGDVRFGKGDDDGAVVDHTKAIEIDPRYANAYFGRGSARFVKGDYDEAIADYTKAIEIDPRYAEAYAFRGVTKVQHGKTGREKLEGARDIDTALKLDGSLKSQLEKLGYKFGQERAPEGSGQFDTPPSSRQGLTTLEYNVSYLCNGERVVVTRCRKDSDQPGYPPTPPDRDYCQVYYPDRPKHGGFDESAVELRGDLIKKLQACTRSGRTAP